MREDWLEYFICPFCRLDLLLERVSEKEGTRIKEATLTCSTGKHSFQIRGFIPRFTSADDMASFGFEWNRHPRTQLDSANGMPLSEERFFRQTSWPRNLCGQKILEVGSGAGRFTEIALQTGAKVFSFDASQAVDANWKSNGQNPNLVLCQANLYQLPFRHNYFDKVFCFGMLQNTPNVPLAFETIARYVRPEGELAVDVFNKDYWRTYYTPIYLIRPVTKRLSHDRLYRWVSRCVPRLMPFSTWLRKHIPFIGHQLSALLPIANYQGLLPTESEELIEKFCILDTFDILSPEYISPQSPDAVHRWFLKAGYDNIEFDRGPVFWMRGNWVV